MLERRREMGVLRAIGASPKAVWLIVVTEGLATVSYTHLTLPTSDLV